MNHARASKRTNPQSISNWQNTRNWKRFNNLVISFCFNPTLWFTFWFSNYFPINGGIEIIFLFFFFSFFLYYIQQHTNKQARNLTQENGIKYSPSKYLSDFFVFATTTLFMRYKSSIYFRWNKRRENGCALTKEHCISPDTKCAGENKNSILCEAFFHLLDRAFWWEVIMKEWTYTIKHNENRRY